MWEAADAEDIGKYYNMKHETFEDCSECPHKAKCLYKYNEETDKNKIMKINERWEDEDFRRFNYRSSEKVYKEFLFSVP